MTSEASRTADFLIQDAGLVLTCAGPAPRAGSAQREVTPVPRASIAARNGQIVFVGTASDCRQAIHLTAGASVIDGTSYTVVPGFVDAHTHALYAGDRRDELHRRLAGTSYAGIAEAGGGILATVRATREASEQTLIEESRPRLDEMLRNGTTTAEVKSGYGLDTANELKMLRAIQQLDRIHVLDLVPTFLGAHELPAEYRECRQSFVACLIEEMIPEVARDGLAEWCDVFCERGVFTSEEAIAILQAGARAGLKPRIHADELSPSGGAEAAAAVRARSADHLIHVTPAGIAALASAGVVATLLPTAAFYLKLGRYAPARSLIAAGVPVALGTDINPGGGFSGSMPFAMALACFGMEMTFEEALIASTLNAAYSIDRHRGAGSLEVGKSMDAVLVRGDAVNLLRVGADSVDRVIKRGRVAFRRS